MTFHKVFPANGVTFVKVTTDPKDRRGVPVPCLDLDEHGPDRHMRIYPATTTQLDGDGAAWSSTNRWLRYLVEDVRGLGELPIVAKSPAAAHMVVEAFRHAVRVFNEHPDANRPDKVNPLDVASVARWTLRLVGQHSTELVPLKERIPHEAR
jgi:hypothetical protein